jgi:hypothetical protein
VFRRLFVFAALALTACQAGSDTLGRDLLANPALVFPPGLINPLPHGGGTGCGSPDRDHLCVGVKYVAYTDATDSPVISRSRAQENLDEINAVWSQCNLSFRMDSFAAVDPTDFRLRYQPADFYELNEIRETFGEDDTLLVVTTGTWDRRGSLGGTSANAWTTLPGSGPYGAVLERPVGAFPNIIGHELGHYLNLLHVSDAADLMNAVIYGSSTRLTSAQCDTARSTVLYFWSRTIR